VPWRDFETPVMVSLADDTPVAATADVVRGQLRRVSQPSLEEPFPIEPEQLTQWTRQPGPPSAAAPLADEGDRRWLWALALALLGAEWYVRRRSAAPASVRAEARVA
jgi:hypothetical protein